MITLTVILSLYLASSFTAATFAHALGGDPVMAQAATLAVPTFFLGVIFTNHRRQHRWLLPAAKLTAGAMGFLNFAFLAALIYWPAWWLVQTAQFPVHAPGIAGSLLAIAAVFASWGILNANTLRVTRYTVRLRKLPSGWEGKEVALVSDVHIGAIRGAAFVKHIVDRLMLLKPHAVLIPGDMFDGAKVDILASAEPWKQLSAPAGIYFVSGNHDEFVDRAPYLTALANAGMHVLQNEKVVVDGMQIIGIHDAETHRPALYRELLAQANVDRERASILLAHRPAHLEIPAVAGISLQVSGHTHAGQFPLWTLVVRSVYGRFAYGLNRVGSLQVVTSSGAGTGGPPLRVFTRSEIVMLRLENADRSVEEGSND